MYETEANSQTEAVEKLPADVVANFCEFRKNVIARTVLPWGEHCTECVWPTCYTSCDLYSPREDGRWRRFIDGMVRLDCPGAVNSYLLKIRFKQWAQLWSPGNVRLLPLEEADRSENRDYRIGSALCQLSVPSPLRKFATSKRYSWKKRQATRAEPSVETPNLFVIECYNPGNDVVSLSLTIRGPKGQPTIPYQRLVRIPPGFHRERVPVKGISQVFDLHTPFSMELIPNEIMDGATLYFGLVDFIASTPEPRWDSRKESRIKCVVGDLDNTLWDGVLVEDGRDKLALKAGVVDVIQELDRRGILHSIASKNNFDEAMGVLKSFGLDEYFLHPQISWEPKSEALKRIAKKLNIGIDSLMLVDDSQFELAEVQSACPGVKAFAADQFGELTDLQICRGQTTEESATRRRLYQEEAVRDSAAERFAGDYLAFLRECRMQMPIEALSQANLERVHELTQRTNQMNFSGNRYERNLLEQIAATKELDTYVISCQDKFGSYGIVGFSIVDSREPRMTDLMFSCRIQAKRVEHAFLTHLLKKYRQASGTDFSANYRKTARNAPSGRVFEDIGMEEISTLAGVTSLVFSVALPIPEDGIIHIVESQPI